MGIAYTLVEILSFEYNEVVIGSDDATLCGNRPCRVDVVARHHAYADTSLLTFLDGAWDLELVQQWHVLCQC